MSRRLTRKALLTYARIFARWGAEEAVRSPDSSGSWKKVLDGQASIGDQLAAFRRIAQDQAEDLQRYRDGYDWKILKGISTGLIQLVDLLERRLDALKKDNQPVRDLEMVRDEVLDMLEAHGVVKWIPDIGATYLDLLDRLETVEAEHTRDQGLVGTVARVHRAGFVRERPDGSTTVVRNARVTIYGAHGEANSTTKGA